MTKENLDVLCIGNAIVDVLAKTDDAFLTDNALNKGTMTLIDAARAETLYAKMGPAVEISGGSAGNTAAALAALGSATGYIGKVAQDQLGAVFRHDIRAAGVGFDTAPLDDGAPTARCMILITPDAQRTMNTYLGACVFLTPADIDESLVARAKATYLEGYLFDREDAKQAFYKAAQAAHAAGRKVSLSLSDPFCVDRHREAFLDLVSGHIDILFANEAELISLYQAKSFEDAVAQVKGHCEIAAVTRGAKGSVIVTPHENIVIKAAPVREIVDTTGAGDLYAAGFLHGWARELPLAECGRIASAAAAEIISQIGARAQRDLAAVVACKKAA